MNNQPLIFERIIRGNLRPWLETNRDEDKFNSTIGDLKLNELQFQPLYEIDFYLFFNCQTRYYHKLIINEANNYCSRIIELISFDDDTRVIKYLLYDTLKKKLRTFLKDIAKLIKVNDLNLLYINPYTSSFNTDLDHKSNTYIIQLLKTATIKVYLEIQDTFKSFIERDDYMEIGVLYLHYLSEPIPEQTFLKRRAVETKQCIETRHCLVSTDIDERVMNSAHAGTESFKFDRLDSNPGALNDVSDSLKLHLLIDKRSSIHDFKRVFSGKEITNPIRWTGNDSEFYWFIHLIYTKYKFVEDLRQQQWKVACHCFIRADGSRFDPAKLRNLKRPKLTGAVIEKAVKLLK